jgi:hypothetical protein
VSAQSIYDLLTRAELFVWLAAILAALLARAYRSFPAFFWLLVFRALIGFSYEWFRLAAPPDSPAYPHLYVIYFRAYWALYLLSTLATFFAIEQLLRSAFSPLSGLSRLVVFVFRFTGVLCLLIAITAHLSVIGKVAPALWFQAFRISIDLCVCAFETALVSVLVANARLLGLSLMNRTFGLGVGFLLFGAADVPALINVILGTPHVTLDLLSEMGLLLTAAIWTVYLSLPEAKRGPLTLKPNSTLMRWNEVVNQLGGVSPMPVPAASFMSEVETLVERIMVRNADRGL